MRGSWKFVFIPAAPFLVLYTGGCGSDGDSWAGGEPSGPAVVPVDSVLLPDSDTLYVGNPHLISLDPHDGTIYIPDDASRTVYRFDRDGDLVRRYGRPGGGPGELRSTGLTFVLDDSTLVVEDFRGRRLNLFDRRTGEYRHAWEGTFPAYLGFPPPVERGDGLWFPVYDEAGHRALMRWEPGSQEHALKGAMPEEYHEARGTGYAPGFHLGPLAAVGDTLVRGWLAYNDLHLYGGDGQVVDTLSLPVARRRGVPDDVIERYRTGEWREANSELTGLHTLPQGGLAFVHHDVEVLSRDGPPPPETTARVWVGATSSDLTEACVDTEVPVSMDSAPMNSFRGDTLFVFDRRISDTPESPMESWIHLYRIDLEGCDWLGMDG